MEKLWSFARPYVYLRFDIKKKRKRKKTILLRNIWNENPTGAIDPCKSTFRKWTFWTNTKKESQDLNKNGVSFVKFWILHETTLSSLLETGGYFQWPSLATSDVSSSILRERNKHLRGQAVAWVQCGSFSEYIVLDVSLWMLSYEVHSSLREDVSGRGWNVEMLLSIRAKFKFGAILAIYRRIIKQFFERFDRIRINSRRMRDYKLEDVTKVEGDSSSSISRAWPISRR